MHAEKNKFEVNHSFIKSESLPTLFTMTFSPLLIKKRLTRAKSLPCSLSKERQERFAPIAIFIRATRAKEQIPNPA